MPSRKRLAKTWEPASLSPKETASLTDFSDTLHASRHGRLDSLPAVLAPRPASFEHRAVAHPSPALANQSCRHSCRPATRLSSRAADPGVNPGEADTDLGFTRDRHVMCASRVNPT